MKRRGITSLGSKNLQDKRPTQAAREATARRQQMEGLQVPRGFTGNPDTFSVLFRPQEMKNIRGPHLGWDPMGVGTQRTEQSSWVPDFNDSGGFEETYSYYPSSYEKLRTTYGHDNPPTPKMVPAADVTGLAPDRDKALAALGELGPGEELADPGIFPYMQEEHPWASVEPEPVGPIGVHPAWTVGQNLKWPGRSRWGNNPDSPQARGMEQLKALSADPLGPHRVMSDLMKVLGGVPGG